MLKKKDYKKASSFYFVSPMTNHNLEKGGSSSSSSYLSQGKASMLQPNKMSIKEMPSSKK